MKDYLNGKLRIASSYIAMRNITVIPNRKPILTTRKRLSSISPSVNNVGS